MSPVSCFPKGESVIDLHSPLRSYFRTVADPETMFNHFEKSLEDEIYGSPKEIMNLWSWTIPGKGFAADYCMRRKVSAVSTTKDAIKVTRLKCGRVQCPNCYEWWMSERVFETSVKILAYARVHNQTPLAISVSEHPDTVTEYTWDDYQKSFRRMYRRMKNRNIDGGYRIFHPYRIQDRYKREMSEMGINDGSGGYWKGVRNNVLELPSWYYYLKLAPHLHVIGFSDWIDECTDKDIVIKNYSTLDTVNDVVGHIRYLLTHAGILADEDTSKPTMPFGAMHRFKMQDHLEPLEILQIKQEVAEAMGVSYNQAKDKIEVKREEEKEDPYRWFPLYSFKIYSLESEANTNAFLAWNNHTPEGQYINGIIERYLDVIDDEDLPTSERHVFMQDLCDPPDSLAVVYDDEAEE